MEKTKILNIDALCITKEQLLEGLDKNLFSDCDGKSDGDNDSDNDSDSECHNGILITPNLDHMVKLQKDREFYDCYREAQWVVCDSKILWLCSKLLKKPFPEPIPGSSFFTDFYLHNANNKECRIFLLGAREGVAAKAMERINARVSEFSTVSEFQSGAKGIVVGAHSPSFGFEKRPEEIDEICRIVNESGANVVLVGVGAPKQEKFIHDYRNRMPGVKIWMALGATIDFEAGNVKRAPRWMQAIAMEWLYRMWCEPKRMFKRYICDDLVFFWYLLKQILGVYKNPFGEK